MDFLDPRNYRRRAIKLWLGYALGGLVVVVVAVTLLYITFGFGIGKNGDIIQSGMVFVSSQPNPAQISLNGQPSQSSSNTRLVLPAGRYTINLARSGYRNWQDTISLSGGTVQHVDYPLLIPTKLDTSTVTAFAQPPGLVSQSPDQRWLVVEKPGSLTDFYLYDLKNPTLAPTTISLPPNLLSPGQSQQLEASEWSDDNIHLVLKHIYDGHTEYILLNRQQPASSINLTKTLNVPFDSLQLEGKKYNQYFIYQNQGGVLSTVSLQQPTPVLFARDALTYKTYGNNMVLYTSAVDAPAGEVNVKLRDGSSTFVIRQLPAGTSYVLDLTTYTGVWYMAMGAASQNKVYIYEDPVGQLSDNGQAVPLTALSVPSPNYLSFSDNARYIMAENGTHFGVYDAENEKTYSYSASAPMDAPQSHALWLDGNHLAYVSGGQLAVFDFDSANLQKLVPANPADVAALTPNGKQLYTVAPTDASGQASLTSTWLLVPADR